MRAALAILVAAIAGCSGPQLAPSPPVTAGRPETVSPVTPTATPTRGAAASPAPSASPATVPASGIDASPLGVLSGQWAFVIVTPTPREGPPPEVTVSELWAIPLDGGAAKLAARFVSEMRDRGRGGNVLYRQLSPDGRQLLLSVGTPRPAGGRRLSLVLLDLATGGTQVLGSDDQDSDTGPAWSSAGRIAYVRLPDVRTTAGTFDDGIWIMDVRGGAARRAVPPRQGVFTRVWDWAPDGRTLAFSYVFEDAILQTIDVDAGTSAAMPGFVESPPSAHSWRPSMPTFAGAFNSTPRQGEHYVVVAERVGAPASELVREKDVQNVLGNVRWHPSRNEILYVRSARGVTELYAVEIGNQAKRIPTAATRMVHVEWAPDGDRIVYLAGDPQSGIFGTSVHLMRRDGTDDRAAFTSRTGMSVADLATRGYAR